MSNEEKSIEKQKGHAPLAGVSDCSFEQDDFCDKCGSSTYWEDCWSCGGEGGRGYDDDLQFEDPLWYSPGDWEECSECHGAGGFEICMNSECVGE